MDKKTQTTYMLSTRDPPQNKTPTQMENEGIKNKIKEMDREKKRPGLQYLY